MSLGHKCPIFLLNDLNMRPQYDNFQQPYVPISVALCPLEMGY